MTLLFNGLTSKQVSAKTRGTEKIFKFTTGATVTVKDWDNNTHNIVYNSGPLNAFNTYRAAATPTKEEATAGFHEIWRTAKLATV